MRCFAIMLFAAMLLATQSAQAADAAFQQWLQSMWPEARKLGVSRATFDAAMRGLEPDLSLPDLVIPGRPEAPPPQPGRVRADARRNICASRRFARLAAQGSKLLQPIPRDAGAHRARVRRAAATSCWRSGGARPIRHRQAAAQTRIRVLATQGFYGKRKDFFRNEFLHALKMLQDGVRARGHALVLGRRAWA